MTLTEGWAQEPAIEPEAPCWRRVVVRHACGCQVGHELPPGEPEPDPRTRCGVCAPPPRGYDPFAPEGEEAR